jgi:general secretion pathway protein K
MKRLLESNDGMALFLVLWVLILLSVIVGEFCYAMRTEINITRNFKEETQAYYIAEAGLNEAIGGLIKNQIIAPKTERIESGEETPEIGWRVGVDIPSVPFGQGQFEVKIGNESGKVNINRADQAFLKMLLGSFDLKDRDRDIIVDSILDWRDKDDLHRMNGAEDDYYGSLPTPYECKDDDFESVEELLMVRGITPEIFYGGLKDMVTVYETPESGNDTGTLLRRQSGRAKPPQKISINAIPPRLLRAIPSMTDELVQEIMGYRKEKDFVRLNDLLQVVGADVYNTIKHYLIFPMGPFYTIESVGKVKGTQTRQRVEAIVQIDGRFKRGYRITQWREGFDRLM